MNFTLLLNIILNSFILNSSLFYFNNIFFHTKTIKSFETNFEYYQYLLVDKSEIESLYMLNTFLGLYFIFKTKDLLKNEYNSQAVQNFISSIIFGLNAIIMIVLYSSSVQNIELNYSLLFIGIISSLVFFSIYYFKTYKILLKKEFNNKKGE